MKLTKLVYLLLIFSNTALSQQNCLSVYGLITNRFTKQPIPNANIKVRLNNELKTIAKSLQDGNYKMLLPCGSNAIIVEAQGYQSLEMPIESFHSILKETSFYVPIPLIAIDKQTADSPYHQNEQKHFVLQNSSSSGSLQNALIRYFQIVDAITGKHVNANICLYYTKNGQRKCQKLSDQQRSYKVSFYEPDIIALEVTALGYQSYQGNLILNKIDGTEKVYEIKLSRELTIISLAIGNSAERLQGIISTRQSTNLQIECVDNQHYYAFLDPHQSYTLKIITAKGEVIEQKKIILKRGLNYEAVWLKQLTTPLETELSMAIPQGVIPDSTTLLFTQSGYELHSINKSKLDTLASLLKKYPEKRMRIIGHTDNVGVPSINQTLSEYRARVVTSYLVNQGIAENRLEWLGKNSQSPLYPNTTEENKIQNRRVVLHLLP